MVGTPPLSNLKMRTPERRTPGGPLRADAQRNRDEILTAAVRVLGEQGLDANLDRIARDAGVGAGPLYRNFRAPRGTRSYRPRSGHGQEEVSVGPMAHLDP
jgi:hypothetical protein